MQRPKNKTPSEHMGVFDPAQSRNTDKAKVMTMSEKTTAMAHVIMAMTKFIFKNLCEPYVHVSPDCFPCEIRPCDLSFSCGGIPQITKIKSKRQAELQ
jgi:hypothetical protein